MESRLPKALVLVPLIVSITLNITGLASLVDGFVTWVGFFGEVVQLYEFLIRQPLIHIVNFVYPFSWPRIPLWVFDIAILWTTFGLSTQLMIKFGYDDIRNVFSTISNDNDIDFSKSKAWVAFILEPAMFIVLAGYIWEFRRKNFAIKDRLTDTQRLKKFYEAVGISVDDFDHPKQKKKLEEAFRRNIQEGTLAIVRLLTWYLSIFGSFIVFLFVNYQIKKFGGERG